MPPMFISFEGFLSMVKHLVRVFQIASQTQYLCVQLTISEKRTWRQENEEFVLKGRILSSLVVFESRELGCCIFFSVTIQASRNYSNCFRISLK